jgi:hypothetical protein
MDQFDHLIDDIGQGPSGQSFIELCQAERQHEGDGDHDKRAQHANP